MKSRPPAQAELSWADVHAFRLRRHHLDRRAPKKDLARVVGDIGAVQAQVMSAAELQIAVRVDCTVADVRRALWTDRTLVKTWLMRGTLHLARSGDLPLYTAAMSRRWIQTRPSWLKFWHVTENEIWALIDEIAAALNGSPMTREELIAAVAKGKPARVLEALRSGWGGMLKPAARNGWLCFGPNRGQSVTFVHPRRWLMSWEDADPDHALTEVARRYLRAYGPATKVDFARWWGAWPGVGVAAWKGLGPDLATVSVEGMSLQMLRNDLESMRDAKLDEAVQLLPPFDPYILGHATRDHLFERVHLPKVSRTAGWISAVVLVNGEVVGTWTHKLARTHLHITVASFRPPASKIKSAVRDRAQGIALALGLRDAGVEFV